MKRESSAEPATVMSMKEANEARDDQQGTAGARRRFEERFAGMLFRLDHPGSRPGDRKERGIRPGA